MSRSFQCTPDDPIFGFRSKEINFPLLRHHLESMLGPIARGWALLATLAALQGALGSAARSAGARGPAPRSSARCTATEPARATFPIGAVEAEFRRKRAGACLYPHKVEVLQAMEPFVEQHLNILRPVDDSWQPQDFLPDMRREDWREQIAELRAECAGLPDALLVAIVGDTVTEEALPTYQTLLNTFEGMEDPTGTSQSPWARWSRGWTAEENRHGDMLNKFLFLTGRIDMRAMEVTTHNLIKDGFNPSGEKDPYRGIIYTSFQERATKISHQNVARLCGEAGAKKLAILTTRIAGDEARCAPPRRGRALSGAAPRPGAAGAASKPAKPGGRPGRQSGGLGGARAPRVAGWSHARARAPPARRADRRNPRPARALPPAARSPHSAPARPPFPYAQRSLQARDGLPALHEGDLQGGPVQRHDLLLRDDEGADRHARRADDRPDQPKPL